MNYIQKKAQQFIDLMADCIETLAAMIIKCTKTIYLFTKEAWQIAIPLYLELIFCAYFFNLLRLGHGSDIALLRYGGTVAMFLMLIAHSFIGYYIVMNLPIKAKITDKAFLLIGLFRFLRDVIFLLAGMLIGSVISLHLLELIR